MATLVAWNLASQQSMAEEPTDSASYRMACTAPPHCDEPLWSDWVQNETGKHVKVAVVFASTCAMYEGEPGENLQHLRDWNLVAWSQNGSHLKLCLLEQNYQGQWSEIESTSSTDENYNVSVDVKTGKIERSNGNSLIGIPSNQINIAKWQKLERGSVGGDGNTNSHSVTVMFEIAVKGTINGKAVDMVFTPCKDSNGQDVPKTFHSWISHPKDVFNPDLE